MAITSVKTGSSFTNLQKYNDFLGPNPAYDPSATFLIQRIAGTGSSGTITFSSIPSTYSHLQLRGIIRNNRNNPSFPFGNMSIRFNGIDGSNANHRLSGNGSTLTASGNTGISSLTIGDTTTDAQAANTLTAFIIDIQDYANATRNKTVRSFIGSDLNGTGRVQLTSALSIATAAVGSIDILNFNSASFTTSTTIALYGMKG